MTALSVWWRRNFGHRNDTVRWLSEVVPGGFRDWWTCHPLREWWRHRNDPPAMLPDRVTITRRPTLLTASEYLDWLNRDEDHTDQGGDKWHLVEYDGPEVTGDGVARAVFRREDGAYRWRDDCMRGF